MVIKVENLRSNWIKSGWKRGAFVDLKDHLDLLNKLPLKLKNIINEKDKAYLIPLLYDCSLIEECFIKEPWVQVLICWPCPEVNGNFKFGKNPRQIHFPTINNGEEKYMHADAIGFCQFEREDLLKATPSKDFLWPEKGLPQLLNWVAERYNQPTFPDEWNTRMGRQKRNLDKLWKNKNFIKSCSGLYFNIHPFDEIKNTDEYSLKAYFVVSSTLTGKEHRDFSDNHEAALIQKLKGIISTIPNINIAFIDSIKEDQFTKSMERDFQRWQLEHLSYKI